MVLTNKNIEQIIEKYEAGTTTIQEEQALKNYFSQDAILPHLEVYKPVFQYFAINKEEQFTKNVSLKTKSKPMYKWLSVAAIVVLMFSAYLFTLNDKPYNSVNDLSATELIEYNQAKDVLAMVSSHYNTGTSSIAYLQEAEDKTQLIFKKQTKK